MVLASENHSKIDPFSHFFRKRRFCENCSFPIGKPLFSSFRAFKKQPKIDAKTRSEKASKKNLPKIDFGLRFDLPKPPKIDPTSKKIAKNRVPKKAPKKQPWELPQIKTRQAFWDPAGPCNHLSND